jgi:hypothetical protein
MSDTGLSQIDLTAAITMLDLSIAQALIEGESLLGASENFTEGLKTDAIAIGKKFGAVPEGSSCAEALFARPIGMERVAVVQVAGPPLFPTLRFRFLILGNELYSHLCDPFAIADRFPPNWEARGALPELDWPPQPLPKRTIEQLDGVLKHGDGPFLLGASQTLVDGGKILLKREAPDPKLLRDLWALLPDSTRRQLWPATYAFSNELGFDVVAMPSIPEQGIPGYLNEDQTRDYPDSRYERSLQMAIESGDQRSLDRLLSRRSSTETLRLAIIILVLGIGVVVVSRLLVTLGVI